MENSGVQQLIKFVNALCILGIAVILLAAFWFQFVLGELPCPLCLLQRLGFLAIGFGFMLNIRYKPRPIHYGFALLAAIATAMSAMRQILLHIEPGSSGYGTPILGFHMYTWSFIMACLIIVYCTIILSISRQYHFETDPDASVQYQQPWLKWFNRFVFGLFLALIIVNSVSLFYECGLKECPDNPTSYRLAKVDS
jgi:disulfide bond formation protein DsbB